MFRFHAEGTLVHIQEEITVDRFPAEPSKVVLTIEHNLEEAIRLARWLKCHVTMATYSAIAKELITLRE